MKSLLLFSFFFFTSHTLLSQSAFIGASAYYSDSFANWEIYNIDTLGFEQQETLDLKWPLRNDWTEWKWDTFEEVLYIDQTYNNNDRNWRLRSPNGTVTLQSKWRKDPRIWRISYGEEHLTWKTAYNTVDQWVYNDQEYGYFEVITTYENDAREWEIIDESSLPDEVKRSMIFIALYVAAPKQ